MYDIDKLSHNFAQRNFKGSRKTLTLSDRAFHSEERYTFLVLSCSLSYLRSIMRINQAWRCFLLFGFAANQSLLADTVVVETTALGGVYYINGEYRANITLQPGNTYLFEGYSAWHPLSLSRTPDGKWQNGGNYEHGVIKTDTSLSIEITEQTPDLFYFCDNHANMGAAIYISKSETPTSGE